VVGRDLALVAIGTEVVADVLLDVFCLENRARRSGSEGLAPFGGG